MELEAGDRKWFVAVEQGIGNMKNNILVIVTLKLKLVAIKWKTAKYGIELKVKEKDDYATTCMPYETPEKTEHADELEKIVDEAIEEPGSMKINNFKKDTVM